VGYANSAKVHTEGKQEKEIRYACISGTFLMSRRGRQKELPAAILVEVLKLTLVASYRPQLRGDRNEQSPSHAFKMPGYLIKPREPTVLSHKEYHELSSGNLTLSAVVRLPFLNDVPEIALTPGPVGRSQPST